MLFKILACVASFALVLVQAKDAQGNGLPTALSAGELKSSANNAAKRRETPESKGVSESAVVDVEVAESGKPNLGAETNKNKGLLDMLRDFLPEEALKMLGGGSGTVGGLASGPTLLLSADDPYTVEIRVPATDKLSRVEVWANGNRGIGVQTRCESLIEEGKFIEVEHAAAQMILPPNVINAEATLQSAMDTIKACDPKANNGMFVAKVTFNHIPTASEAKEALKQKGQALRGAVAKVPQHVSHHYRRQLLKGPNHPDVLAEKERMEKEKLGQETTDADQVTGKVAGVTPEAGPAGGKVANKVGEVAAETGKDAGK